MIDQAIFNWISFVTGAPVKKAPYSGKRPASDYLTYQVQSIVPQMHGYRHEYEQRTGNEFDWNRYTSAEMRVSINAYAPGGMAMLNKLTTANDWWEAKQQLKSDGDDIVFVSSTQPQNLTGLGDEGYRSRYQSDYTFNITLKDERTKYAIQQWLLTGEFSNPLETIESAVSLTVDYPV